MSNDAKLTLFGVELDPDGFADGAAVEHSWGPFIEADFYITHDAFLRVAARGDLHDVTDHGSLICRYMCATRDGRRRRGFAEVFSDCPGEV